MKKLMALSLLCVVFSLLSGCSRLGFPGVYKIPIEQGNILSTEQIEQLKPGMTKSQVEYVLGTPLIKDSFDTDRWDYQYRLFTEGNLVDQYMLSVFFNNNKMTNYKTTVKNRSNDLSQIKTLNAPKAKKKPWYRRWF